MNKLLFILVNCLSLLAALLTLYLAIDMLADPDIHGLYEKSVLFLVSSVFFWVFFRVNYPQLRHLRRVSRLSKCGVPARAKVISVELTGVYLNEQPQLAYTLEYNHPKTGQRIRGVTREYTTLLDLPAARNGDLLPILVDPKVSDEFIIDQRQIVIDQQKINADMERENRRRIKALPLP